jgi:hypothetical protein
VAAGAAPSVPKSHLASASHRHSSASP